MVGEARAFPRPLQGIASPRDESGRSIEVVLAHDLDGYCWAVRIDDWYSVMASTWQPLDTLAALPHALDARPGEPYVTGDVAFRRVGEHAVEVTVTPEPGRPVASIDRQGFGFVVSTLLDRAAAHAEGR